MDYRSWYLDDYFQMHCLAGTNMPSYINVCHLLHAQRKLSSRYDKLITTSSTAVTEVGPALVYKNGG